MFAYKLHGGLILAQGFPSSIGIVLVFTRTFQEDTVFARDLEHVAIHSSLQSNAFRLLQVIWLLKMIDDLGGIAQRIADVKAHVVGIPYRIILDRYPIVQMRDDRYRFATL